MKDIFLPGSHYDVMKIVLESTTLLVLKSPFLSGHTYFASIKENIKPMLRFYCLCITVMLQHFFACCCQIPQLNVKLFETSSSHARCGWVLGIFCRFSKTYFFCIFEASGIRFKHQIRGLRQYSCHRDNSLNLKKIARFSVDSCEKVDNPRPP